MADALSAAKGALHSADNFDKSVAHQSGHEYSSTPYSHAYTAKKASVPSQTDKEIGDVASGIKWRQEQAKVVNPQ
jgi:hypothetical protein